MIKLFVIGDSLSQGFHSGAVFATHLSFPSLLAYAMRIPPAEFRVPDFSGEGGLLVNLEQLVRRLADRYGEHISWLEFPFAVATVHGYLDRVEDYWERGPGKRASPTGPLHHNVAVWGFDLADANSLTERICRERLIPPEDGFVRQIVPDGRYRTARRVLNPGFSPTMENLTQLGVAERMAQDHDGIENLIFWLGSNHCLPVVLELDGVHWTKDASGLGEQPDRRANLWRTEHFAEVFRRVADRIDALNARFVFVGNVPHVTIPPVTRGVSLSEPERVDGYYEFYTRFWVWDDDFRKDPESYSKLTREEVRVIDQTVDEYNQIIADEAQRRGWHVMDACRWLDKLAFRRQGGQPTYEFPRAMVEALRAHPVLSYLAPPDDDSTKVRLDTRFVALQANDHHRLSQGGFFSLDGVHPTTTGYALTAYEFLQVMNAAWEAAGLPPVELTERWWSEVISLDTLMVDPPINLDHLRELLGFLAGRGFLRDMLVELTGRALR